MSGPGPRSSCIRRHPTESDESTTYVALRSPSCSSSVLPSVIPHSASAFRIQFNYPTLSDGKRRNPRVKARDRKHFGIWLLELLWPVRRSFSGGGSLDVGPWSFSICLQYTAHPLTFSRPLSNSPPDVKEQPTQRPVVPSPPLSLRNLSKLPYAQSRRRPASN